jgi:hypothetical protein
MPRSLLSLLVLAALLPAAPAGAANLGGDLKSALTAAFAK